MTVVDSLPPRPLEAQELLQLNESDALELAVPIEDEGRVSGVLVATDAWVKGLAFDADAGSWTVVETVALAEGVERVDGLQSCEAAILRFRGDDPDAMTPEDAPGTYEPVVERPGDGDVADDGDGAGAAADDVGTDSESPENGDQKARDEDENEDEQAED